MLEEFSDNDFKIEAGAWLAGYDIGHVLNKSQELKELILKILEREIVQATGGISSYMYGKGYFEDVDTIKKIITLIIRGINK